MRQSLQVRQSQTMAMTPQLQQAIRMLQLSSLELQQEIQQVMESNLMLEEEFDEIAELEEEQELLDRPIDEMVSDNQEPSASDDSFSNADMDIHADSESMPDDLPVDSEWEDTFDIPQSSASSTEEFSADALDHSVTSLQDHLLWQLHLSRLSPTDMAIGEAIIDAINNDGFIAVSVADLTLALQQQQTTVEEDEVVAMIHRIQQFDPPGVAAMDLRESLLLQLAQYSVNHDVALAERILFYYFDPLANRDYAQLKRRLKLDDEQLSRAIKIIQSLNPRPGSGYSDAKTDYVVPDVFVRKQKDRWIVSLNPDASPKLRVNSQYAAMMPAMNSDDASTVRSHLQEARWFIKSLQQRNDTLLRVSSRIVEHQQGFLEQGEVAMKAMVLADIATELEMHESTISRTTNRKYMHTPRGVFELKYFFSSHVATDAGGECSSTAIRAMIKDIVAGELPQKPLSDNKIATLLSQKGINVARRTVAKYREAMAIAPSNERKRLT